MRLNKEERRTTRKARRARARIRRAARKILNDKYGVSWHYLSGTGAILGYIAYYRPELSTLPRDERLEAFTGLRLSTSGERAVRKPKPKKTVTSGINPNSDAFLESYEWRQVRMVVLKRDGARCACCGATPADGLRMHVDHIKPRRKFPELALDPRNLQVLCEVCNHGKGNWDQTDWRKKQDAANETEFVVGTTYSDTEPEEWSDFDRSAHKHMQEGM